MNRRDGENFLWLLAGMGLGAAIALLFAPQSGRDTRRYLSRLAREGRERVLETGEEFADRGKKVYEHGKAVVDEAMEFVDRGRRTVFR